LLSINWSRIEVIFERWLEDKKVRENNCFAVLTNREGMIMNNTIYESNPKVVDTDKEYCLESWERNSYDFNQKYWIFLIELIIDLPWPGAVDRPLINVFISGLSYFLPLIKRIADEITDETVITKCWVNFLDFLTNRSSPYIEWVLS
jgi:hypothetical protein